jgi:hypothetical protein
MQPNFLATMGVMNFLGMFQPHTNGQFYIPKTLNIQIKKIKK